MSRLAALKKKRAEEEAAWKKLMAEAETVFKNMSELDENPEVLTKEALVAVQFGDFKVFEEADVDNNKEMHYFRSSLNAFVN